jgi:hypothetical protein
MVFYILIFTFLDSKREGESLWTEEYQAFAKVNLLLTSL